MWKRIVIVGATAAVIGGAGTAAFAASAAPSLTASPTSTAAASDIVATPSTTTAVKHPGANQVRRAVHATWVTENKKTATFTTHDAIRGQVTAVSSTSITVRSADNVVQTYVISARTKVFTRAPSAPGSQSARTKTAASIADVHSGDAVLVGGVGRTALSALRVIDMK
jgi:hypothetical protein